ncbi:MAG: DUF72 domain-containing protein [Pyrobaculum sp.]
MKVIFVGVCGFPKSRKVIYNTLDVVELQETFYNMPTLDKMRRLREEAPNFRFTVKVFQGITHPPDSPTFRKTRGFKPSEKHGMLRPTLENFQLWEEFVKTVEPLRPDLVVFQTPPSLRPEPYIYDFFSSIVGKLKIAWEPRGRTYEDLRPIERVIELGVLLVVDPLRRQPPDLDMYYFRLHGLGSGEVNYRYKYTVEDFKKLLSIIRPLRRTIYTMFNNVFMYDDAVAFRNIIQKI